MIQLIYASAATVDFGEEDLKELLAIARVNNESLEVTGMLLYQDGAFLQILEGEEKAVQQLYLKLERDKRHNNVRLLSKSEIQERSFGDWKMGFFNASGIDLQQFPGFSDFFRNDLPFDETDIDRAKSVLLQFREGAWRQKVDSTD